MTAATTWVMTFDFLRFVVALYFLAAAVVTARFVLAHRIGTSRGR